MLDLWYKNAVIYCIDIETYMDSNGDGVGDFQGLTQRLDYINGLGVTCIWLMPFYPSPNKDNGYDVTDYYNVDPRLGTLGDFVEFTRQAHERGIRVIVDLVVNHTSDQHPWFQAACKDRNSKYRNYYIWSEEKPEDAEEGIMFPGIQDTTWTYNEEAGAYYFHRFYDHQADLNVTNPEVREEIHKIVGFWIALGVSGFRVDAAPYFIEIRGEDRADVEDPFLYLKEIRNFLSWRRGDAILLAEANVPAKDITQYFGDGDMMQMLFSFIVNQNLILALAREKAEPLIQALKALPEIPEIGQWAQFIRNHDELTLDQLSDAEQDEIAAQFAPDKDKMWIFGRGIRRRFAPMVNGDQRRLQLAYSLMLTLPGTPVINYGEEIGMGDDLSLEERQPARTPMQWSSEPNAGFSTALADQLVLPVITEGEYSYKHVNVIVQRCDPKSLLNWMERAIRMRKECPEFGWGKWQIIETGNPSVLAHRCEWHKGVVIAVHNLSSEACNVSLELEDDDAQHLTDLVENQSYKVPDDDSHHLQLEGYGYRWFRVGGYHL
ncbi:alpha-amylase family protein [Chroococcidiopsis sp. CCMEE 29]|uniref:Alpha-amylase n=1 Tax=Chroococcidiopsis sp. CCMEE 29 TaxID=155894 RepID=A0A6M6ICJ8_9CYAN|nr:alpha-amylase family protein [Chroococcidiopsis sp. CCMEE 29]QJY30849.1 maltose alpha-D-glucosyltransferase [Chroococcidiopsis sp. CCMEE 29]